MKMAYFKSGEVAHRKPAKEVIGLLLMLEKKLIKVKATGAYRNFKNPIIPVHLLSSLNLIIK